MCKICPKCNSIAEYNAYYGRITCTKCAWESDNYIKPNQQKFFTKSPQLKKRPSKNLVKV